MARVAALTRQGLTTAAIRERIGISEGAITSLRRQARAAGLLPDTPEEHRRRADAPDAPLR